MQEAVDGGNVKGPHMASHRPGLNSKDGPMPRGQCESFEQVDGILTFVDNAFFMP